MTSSEVGMLGRDVVRWRVRVDWMTFLADMWLFICVLCGLAVSGIRGGILGSLCRAGEGGIPLVEFHLLGFFEYPGCIRALTNA